MRRYRKNFPFGIKIALYIGLFTLVALCAAICLVDAIRDARDSQSIVHLVPIAGMALISFVSLLYTIAQDILRIYNERKTQPVFTWDNSIPFADREELLDEMLQEVAAKIMDDSNCLQKNMRFIPKNGKSSFAKKLCMQLQDIRYKKKGSVSFPKEAANKIGNICLIEYSSPTENFELKLKTSFSCIRGKKNIIVIVNVSGDPMFEWVRLTDPSVLLVILNFNRKSKDMLFFSDNKIMELFQRLKDSPHYGSLFEGKTDAELHKMATRLGDLSHNNIGELVELISSKDFSLLMETDQTFMEFYRAIRSAKYDEAQKQYDMISSPDLDNLSFRYKRDFEHANLTHFLGRYGDSYKELEILISSMSLHPDFLHGPSGKMLYSDAVVLQSHVLKHQGQFDSAAAKLNEMGEDQRDLVWMRAHFSINIFQMNELDTNSSERKQLLASVYRMMEKFKEEREQKDSDYYFYEAFYPIVEFYHSHFDREIIPSLIEMEEDAIRYYKENEQRYVTNCYFIKAELFRMAEKWSEAKQFYEECYTIYCFNGDKDILYLVAITCKCIELFDGQSMEFGCDFDAAIAECKQQEGYGFHQRLISKMELAQRNPEFRAKWLAHYRRTINPIP